MMVGGVMRHILSIFDMANELKSLGVDLTDGLLVESIMSSLLACYALIKTSYNTNEETWNIIDLVSFIINEELDP
jgi:hypothetical protein